MSDKIIHDNVDQLLTERQTSAVLQICVRTLQKWRVTGEGPIYKKLGHLVRYRVGDLQRWVHDRTISSTSAEINVR